MAHQTVVLHHGTHENPSLCLGFNRGLVYGLVLCSSLLLAACNETFSGIDADTGTGTESDKDVTAPNWAASESIGINDDIVFRFDESIDTSSLTLTGSLSAIVESQSWSQTTIANDTLTLTPPAEGWYSGRQDMTISVKDAGGNTASGTTTFAVRLRFDHFQSATRVIGQGEFTSNAANRGGTAAADTLNNPTGDPMVIDGRLWLVDANNHRLLGYNGIPSTNSASATWVIGQTTFTASAGGTSDTMLLNPFDVAYDQSTLFVSDAGNSRVLIYDGVPLSPPATAGYVVGQADMTATGSGCSESSMQYPDGIIAVDGKLIMADWANSRVLIWNSLPSGTNKTAPDLVLGQSDFMHCTHRDDDQDGASETDPTARTLSYPGGVWSDGERLLVADTDNSRVLIWNTFPTSSFQPADVVIGHATFLHDTERDDDQDHNTDSLPTARTLADPTRVWSNGLQIVMTDQGNHRVLMWNDYPTENFQPADIVLGQADFAGKNANDDDQDYNEDASPTARTLKLPFGVGVYRNKLLVSDTGNHRVLVFESK